MKWLGFLTIVLGFMALGIFLGVELLMMGMAMVGIGRAAENSA